MTLRYHPEPSTLASYVAGALPQSIAVLVSAHAEMCPACKRDLRVAEAIAGAALVCTPAVAVEEDAFGRLSERMTAAAPYALLMIVLSLPLTGLLYHQSKKTAGR